MKFLDVNHKHLWESKFLGSEGEFCWEKMLMEKKFCCTILPVPKAVPQYIFVESFILWQISLFLMF